jgi:hypothetical protein
MNTSEIFNEFLSNLVIQNKNEISTKYNSITKRLNDSFHGIESETSNSLQVGSYGRKTAVNGISDLDMIFELSNDTFKKYDNYETNGQSALLQDVKTEIKKTYTTTDVRGDGQVVIVNFTNYVVEVCPVFLQSDGTYKFPDSNKNGSWKKTNPRPEIKEINDFNTTTNGNLKNLTKICRAWKNKCGVKMGGLLIDTLCYEFLKNNENHHSTTLLNYDVFMKDFFCFLKDYDNNREHWFAPGSNQKVYKKKSNFIGKAKKAHANIIEAIEKKENKTVYEIWKRIFGYPFPYPKLVKESSLNFTSSEEYIEDLYAVDIINSLTINCEVTQAGFRNEFLRNMLDKLKVNKKLKFFIENTDVQEPYSIKWKVKNEGEIAKQKNNFRGQVSSGNVIKNETSTFGGSHFVECYIIKNNICVARDRIEVPISSI